jgi:hypothetical protein
VSAEEVELARRAAVVLGPVELLRRLGRAMHEKAPLGEEFQAAAVDDLVGIIRAAMPFVAWEGETSPSSTVRELANELLERMLVAVGDLPPKLPA